MIATKMASEELETPSLRSLLTEPWMKDILGQECDTSKISQCTWFQMSVAYSGLHVAVIVREWTISLHLHVFRLLLIFVVCPDITENS